MSKDVTKSDLIKYCVAGTISAFGFAPLNIFPLFIASFSWFFIQLSNELNTKPIRNSFLFFLSLHIVTLYWLIYPLTIDFSRHWILIPFALIVIPTYFAIQLTFSCFFVKKFSNVYSQSLIFSSLFCISTYIYGHFSLGFPWILPAYIWNSHEVFMQTLSIYGPYGLGLITVFISSILGTAFIFKTKKDPYNTVISFSIAIMTIIFITIFGIWKLSSNKTEFTKYTCRIVQCNIYQENKNDKQLSRENLTKHLNFSRDTEKKDFIIWPEAVIPFLYRENHLGLQKKFSNILHNGTYLITGAVREDIKTEKIYNSAIFIDNNGKNIANYDKSHLVPFGEYIPFRSFIPETFQSIASDIGDFDIGSHPQVININGLKISMAICYEAVFPIDFLPKNQDIDVIINVTNDAWFGPTLQPYQHLQIVRARSIETGIPLLRATNYGISAVFDANGRELKRIDMNNSGFIDVNIPKKLQKLTPYRKYGDSIFWFITIAMILIALFLESRNSRHGNSKKSISSIPKRR